MNILTPYYLQRRPKNMLKLIFFPIYHNLNRADHICTIHRYTLTNEKKKTRTKALFLNEKNRAFFRSR